MKCKKLRNIVAVAVTALTIATICPASASADWKQNSTGWWNTEGSSYSVGWRNISNNWYYFGSDGYMKTNWINNNGTWYFADQSGAMKTGWINSNGTWYYADASGAMKTGWINSNGTWYYTNQAGAMQTGLVTINNNTYYLNEAGVMQTGNITVNGVNYTFAASGEKISSSATMNNIKETENNGDTSTGSGSSSGGGGGSSSSSNSSSKISSKSSYNDLCGRWTVKDYVGAKNGEKLPQKLIDLAVGEHFTVKSDNISSGAYIINDPKVEESIITSDNLGDTLKNAGISGNKVKCIHVSENENSNRSVDVLVSDNGKVYAVVKDNVFKLEKSNK